MPQAATHFILTLLILSVIREYFIKRGKSLPAYYVFIGALLSLIPDFDIALFWISYFFGYTFLEIHRTFSHNLFIPLFFILLSALTIKLKTKSFKLKRYNIQWPLLFLVIGLGTFIHLILDFLFEGVVYPLYPLMNFAIGLDLLYLFPEAIRRTIPPVLDAVLLIIWLIYMEYKHKISNFV